MNAFNLTGTRYACKRRRNGHAAHVGKRMYVCTCMPQVRNTTDVTLPAYHRPNSRNLFAGKHLGVTS